MDICLFIVQEKKKKEKKNQRKGKLNYKGLSIL